MCNSNELERSSMSMTPQGADNDLNAISPLADAAFAVRSGQPSFYGNHHVRPHVARPVTALGPL
jgi:hypothetical protein